MKRIAMVCVMLIILCVAACGGGGVESNHSLPAQKTVPLTTEDTWTINEKGWNADRIIQEFPVLQGYMKEEILPGSILILGDSITYLDADGAKLLGNPRVVNRACPGFRLMWLTKLVDRFIYSHPSKVFIMIGINDITRNMAPSSFPQIVTDNEMIENYRIVINTIHRQSPQTEIFIESVLPTADTARKEQIVSFNDKLKTLCLIMNTTYIDLYPLFVLNGFMNPVLSSDGTHLNDTGRTTMADILRSCL